MCLDDNVTQDVIRLFHGSPDPDFKPVFGSGRDYHDYGNAFYCTNDFESAAEWACLRKTIETAYVYEYDLLIPGNISPKVEVLNFDKLDTVYWLSALLEHRVDDDYRAELYERSMDFVEKYPTNCDKYDIIHGWRANDRHFAIIRDFLNTLITLETAREAIMYGDLGKQVVVKSERAYSWLLNDKKPVNKTTLSGTDYKYRHESYIQKDIKGRINYDKTAQQARKSAKENKSRGTTILDLLR